MAISILMPKVSFIVTEGTIVSWLKEPGEVVEKGEPLFQMESEKATIEVESPGSGIMGNNFAPAGTTVPVTTTIGYLLQPGEACPALHIGSSPAEREEAPTVQEQPAEPKSEAKRDRVKASPLAKRLADENGVDLEKVTGTGPNGRITQDDVQNYIQEQASAAGTPKKESIPAAPSRGIQPVETQSIQSTDSGVSSAHKVVEQVRSLPDMELLESELVTMTNIQRVAAERMAMSFGTAPHFYLSLQVDMSQAVAMRQALLPAIEAKSGVRLSFTDILTAAVALSLVKHPELNAAYENGSVRRFGPVNIGLAVDTPRGLTVAVLHQADRLSLAELARKRSEVTERARINQSRPEELSQGTFTISNLGMFGIDLFNAIINPPQAAILAVGRIVKRPVVVEDTLSILPTMWMSLSVDHRVADGASGARFLQTLVGILENPYRLIV